MGQSESGGSKRQALVTLSKFVQENQLRGPGRLWPLMSLGGRGHWGRPTDSLGFPGRIVRIWLLVPRGEWMCWPGNYDLWGWQLNDIGFFSAPFSLWTWLWSILHVPGHPHGTSNVSKLCFTSTSALCFLGLCYSQGQHPFLQGPRAALMECFLYAP